MALIVIEVVTLSSGRSASSRRMSSSESMATPTLPDLALGARMVGVVPHLGGQVEGAGQTGLPRPEQELEPGVGGLGRAEPGVLAHRPEAAPVHVGADAAGEGVAAGHAQPGGRIPAREVIGAVDRADLDARVGGPVVRRRGDRALGRHRHRLRSPLTGVRRTAHGAARPCDGRAEEAQPGGASSTCGMQRSSYSAITISPASGPQAGQFGSRRTRNVRKLCSRAS